MTSGPVQPGTGVYFHVPFCASTCDFCAFYQEQPKRGDIDRYLEAMEAELALEPPGRVETAFWGGGTPGLLPAVDLFRLGRALTKAAGQPHEWSVELAPSSVRGDKLAALKEAGVTRVSLGVQSFDEATLDTLGRRHSPKQVMEAWNLVEAAGFQSRNLDLMFALPRQTEAEAAADLAALIALAPTHISYYHLTLEPNTAFAAAPPPLPDSDSAYAMLEAGQALLAAAGYGQYETSAYAQPGFDAAHNLNYWRFGDYLGVGAGAHGKRTLNGVVERRARHKHPKTYMESAGTPQSLQEVRTVAGDELAFEYCLNALRLHEGFAKADFEAHTGLAFSRLEPRLEKQRQRGLIAMDATHVRPTPLGRDHLNTLLTELL